MLFIVLNLIKSRTGRAIMSIRDNRIAAESVGVNVTRYKLVAFTISAALAGLAGALLCPQLSPRWWRQKFDYNTSILDAGVCRCWAVWATSAAPSLPQQLLTVLPELLRGLSDYRMLVYAVVLIAGDAVQPESAAGRLAHAG